MATNWAVLGIGRIAVNAILPAFSAASDAVLTALASRSAERAREYAEEFGVKQHYQRYSDLLDDPDADAVYVALPNHLHARWAREALMAGKSALIEKPAVLSVAEARELVDLAAQRNLLIGEASMYRYRRHWAFVESWLAENSVPGEPVLMRAHVGYDIASQAPPGEFRLDPAMGGGALLDVGVYPVGAASALFGRARSGSLVQFRIGDGAVDDLSTGSLEFTGSHILSFTCDFRHAWVNTPLEIRTRKATLLVEHVFNPGEHPTEVHVLRQGRAPDVRRFPGQNAYAAMLGEFSRNVPMGAASDFARREAEHLLCSAHNLSLLREHGSSTVTQEVPR